MGHKYCTIPRKFSSNNEFYPDRKFGELILKLKSKGLGKYSKYRIVSGKLWVLDREGKRSRSVEVGSSVRLYTPNLVFNPDPPLKIFSWWSTKW